MVTSLTKYGFRAIRSIRRFEFVRAFAVMSMIGFVALAVTVPELSRIAQVHALGMTAIEAESWKRNGKAAVQSHFVGRHAECRRTLIVAFPFVRAFDDLFYNSVVRDLDAVRNFFGTERRLIIFLFLVSPRKSPGKHFFFFKIGIFLRDRFVVCER